MNGLTMHRSTVLFLLLGLGLPGAVAAERFDPDFPPATAPYLTTGERGGVRGASSFEVRASRFGLSTTRRVDVEANAGAEGGTLLVRFDRPVRFALGVDRLSFSVDLLDAAGRRVGVIEASLADGGDRIDVPFDLPGAGRYRLVLRERAIDAGRARVQIRPGGAATLDLAVPHVRAASR